LIIAPKEQGEAVGMAKYSSKENPLGQAESEIVELADKMLERTFGKEMSEIGPGLRWLTGNRIIIPYHWLDHPEYRRKDGKRTMIGRPYGLNGEEVAEILELAQKKKLSVWIGSPSNWNSSTIVVALTEI
jgi:hypothetical protein